MIHKTAGETPYFILHTVHTSYVFRVMPTGQLEHLYYGKRLNLEREDTLSSLQEQLAFAPGCTVLYDQEHGSYTLDEVDLELSALGKGDLREPFVALVHADGGRSSDFTYDRAELGQEKPPFETLPGSYSESGKVEHLCVFLRDKQYDLLLELHYYVYADCDCICRSARLINESQSPVQLQRLLSLQLELSGTGWAVTSFHGAWIREMQKSTLTLPAGKFVLESRSGSSSNRCNPFFMVHDPAATEVSGDCFGFNLIYSGNHYSAAEVGCYGKTRIVTGLHPESSQFLLSPGECFEAPEAVMTYAPDGFTGQSLNMQHFVREHIVRGSWKRRARPVLLNSWEACYFNISENGMVSLAKTAKELGIELFVMDDGWFGERANDTSSLGDWTPNAKKLPGGIAGICKKINDLGLDFGLWVEPEMLNVNSKLYAAHPDWAMAIPGKPHSEGRNQRLLDLANPQVQDYLIEQMSSVFSAAPIRYVKWDYNRVFSDVYSLSLPADRQSETAHRYILGLYRIMNELTRRFPEILFEGCASGGNRFDLGILCYFPQIWGSDDTDAIARASIQEGYSYGYPLNTVGAHVSASPNHQTLRATPLETRFNVASFGALGYESDLRDLSPEAKKQVKEQIALYKKWRDVLQQGDFYRIQSGNLHKWCCVSADRKKAVGMLLLELVHPNEPFHSFQARGLDPNAYYHFYSFEQKVSIKRFGSLVNMFAPIHVKQDSIVEGILDRRMKMPGETEDCIATGESLMRAGVKLKQAFSSTGYSEKIRFFSDFSSRLYFMEQEDEI